MHKSTDELVVNSQQSVEAQRFLSEESKLWDRYEMQKVLVSALQATEYHKHLAVKVRNCHKDFRHKRCDQGHDWASPNKARRSCSNRLCPHCAHRKAKMLATRMQKFLLGRTGLRYVVLAERNSVNLEAGKKSLWEAWHRLRRSVCWKRKVKGCIVVMEVTYNKKQKTWHPHLNVLMEGDYFPQLELRQAWEAATEGRGRTAYIRAADHGTVYELIKYTTEIPDLVGESAVLDEYLSAVYGAHLIRTYGTFRSFNVEDDEEKEVEEKCPDCGSANWVDLGPAPPYEQLRFDFEKSVFRIVVKKPAQVARAWIESVAFNSVDLNFANAPVVSDIAVAVEMRRRMRLYERAVGEKFVLWRAA